MEIDTVYGGRQTISDKGIITENARYVFTYGQCHSLALAINKFTNWPIVGLMSEDEFEATYSPHEMQLVLAGKLSGRKDPGHHVVVKSPKGLLDINGLLDSSWDDQEKIPLTPEDVRLGLKYYLPVTENQVIDTYAKHVAKKYIGVKL